MQRWIDDDQPMQIQPPIKSTEHMEEDEEDDNRSAVMNGHANANFVEHQIKQETGSS